MIPASIEHEILIQAPVETVWSVVTEPDQIRLWFSDTVELDLHPGSPGKLIFGDEANTDHHVARLRVESVERPHRFAFRWEHPEGEEPGEGNSMLVEFALVAEGTATRLRVTESGFREMVWSDDEKMSYIEDHRKGWEHHIGRLNGVASGQA